jgi:hypothetical protein
MKKILIPFVLMFFCISCKEKVQENLLLKIKNRTDSPIHIKLFPKKTTESGGFYPMSDFGGMHGLTESDLSLHTEKVLYRSKDLTIKPYVLASNIFDSIYVYKKDSILIIKFIHNTVEGYSENLFTENSVWDYRIEEWVKKTNMKSSPQKDHCFTFSIFEEKILAIKVSRD